MARQAAKICRAVGLAKAEGAKDAKKRRMLGVEDTLIVELNACQTLVTEHVAQILGYLRSARNEDGLLMNFGHYKFQIRKYAMSHESFEF